MNQNKEEQIDQLKKIELEARKRVDAQRKALAIVERLLEPTVVPEYLLDAIMYISRAHYKDLVEERSIIRLCGYPICNKNISKNLTKKYQICTRTNKVYDVTNRNKFCCNVCYTASQYLHDQISTQPIWLDKPLRYSHPPKLYSQNCGSPGEAVVIDPASLISDELKQISLSDHHDNDNVSEVNNSDHDALSADRLHSDYSTSSSNPRLQPKPSPPCIVRFHLEHGPTSNDRLQPDPSLSPNARLQSDPSLSTNARSQQEPSLSPNARSLQEPSLSPNARPQQESSLSPNARSPQEPSLSSNARSQQEPSLSPIARPQLEPNLSANDESDSKPGPLSNSSLQAEHIPTTDATLQPEHILQHCSNKDNSSEKYFTCDNFKNTRESENEHLKNHISNQSPSDTAVRKLSSASLSTSTSNNTSVKANRKLAGSVNRTPKKCEKNKSPRTAQLIDFQNLKQPETDLAHGIVKVNVKPQLVLDRLSEWKTIDTSNYLSHLNYKNFKSQAYPLESQIHAKHRYEKIENVCSTTEDEKKVLVSDKKSLPKDYKTEKLQIHERTLPEHELINPEKTLKEQAEFRLLPPVDSASQHSIQRNIVYDKIKNCLPEFRLLFRNRILSEAGLNTHINNLINTFRLTSRNIVLRPDEWTLISFIMFVILLFKMKPSTSVNDLFTCDAQSCGPSSGPSCGPTSGPSCRVTRLTEFLRSTHLTVSDLDLFVTSFCSSRDDDPFELD